MNQIQAEPILKWAGGKRQLIGDFKPLFPKINIDIYAEPFLGGGAVFFNYPFTGKENIFINDVNPELTNLYEVISKKGNIPPLVEKLKEYKEKNNSDFFYQIREIDRKEDYLKLNPINRAARIIFLNKTCFNGLYRVNSKGYFNVPYGKYKNPNIVNEDGLLKVCEYFNQFGENMHISCGDFDKFINEIIKLKINKDIKIFVYLDPPYIPVASNNTGFTSYTKGSFSMDDQLRLRNACNRMDKNGIMFMLSNAEHEFIYKEYKKYKIDIVKANRAINSKGSGRGKVNEVVVRNY